MDQEKNAASFQGKILKDQEKYIEINLQGIVTVVSVDDLQMENHIRIVVDKFTLKQGATATEAESSDLLQPGDTIERIKGKKQNDYLVNTQPAEGNILQGLKMVFGQGGDDLYSEDELLENQGLKRVGESWPVNIPKHIEVMKNQNLSQSPESIHGRTTLEKIVDHPSGPCAEVKHRIELKPFSAPLPAGSQVRHMVMVVDQWHLLPLDPKAIIPKQDFKIQTEGEFSMRPNPQTPMIDFKFTKLRTVAVENFRVD
ncbi:MAG: hypothetical protein LR011_07800 [Verrucomicrobia bacterium]|nr:hypothetical protein [Verrucomicrobiota bacterium]